MEFVGGKDNDEVLHSSMTCLVLTNKAVSLLRPNLMERWVSWESRYEPTMSQTLLPPFPPILTKRFSAIFLIQMWER